MSLATRCSSCGTVFRVVQDQLKVSEGWVRCGRCNEVFNALEGLFDLDRETPPEWEPDDREEWAQQPAPAATAATDEPDHPETRDPRLVDKIDAELFGQRGREPDASGLTALSAIDAHDRLADTAASLDREAIDHPLDADDEPPDFLRRAERAQRWQRPWVRAVLASLSIVLLASLGLQGAHHFRNDVVARWPDAAPSLAAWCEAIGCSIGAPCHIDEIAVESTALSRVGTSDNYRLTIVLRNLSGLVTAMPSVDLALTDAAGQLIARRALSRSDFASAPPQLPAGGEATLQTALSAGATRITGYTVEVFYP